MHRQLADRPAPLVSALARGMPNRLLRFGLVGLTGLAINTITLMVAVEVFHLNYLGGVVLATQASTAWNYFLTERFVFTADNNRFGGWTRFGQFWTMNNAALVLRGPMVWLLTDMIGVHYLVSNIASLVLIMIGRYAISERLIWRQSAAPEMAQLTADTATSLDKAAPADPDPKPSAALRTGFGLDDDAPTADDNDSSLDGSDETPTNPDPRPQSIRRRLLTRPGPWVTLLILAVAVTLRLAFLNSLGFNSDEAVYAGQGASLAGDPVLIEYFPIFRAHPLLFQATLSVVFFGGVSPLAGRLTAAVFGIATVGLTYLLGKQMYGRRAGAIAALLLAAMPYHVIVTRQVLLDGPMVFFSTLSLYLLIRFVDGGRPTMLYASVAAMGLTFLTNERSVVLIGGIYLFFAISPKFTVTFKQVIISSIVFVLMAAPYPLSVTFSGKSTTGEQFLAWQLFRRANHGLGFYFVALPPAIGWLVLLSIIVGAILMRKERTWRATVLICWCIVPFLFFQIWPVKGFQYLLALAPPAAVAAGHALASIPDRLSRGLHGLPSVEPERKVNGVVRTLAVVIVTGSLLVTSWGRISPAGAGESFLAGSGGVPGGREAGEWVGQNLPEGAQLLAIGPSMANIIQWYGDRKTYGLSVSPNPLHRNPVYEPIVNPDLLLRNGDLHYLVWDSFSASRSTFFSDKLLVFAERYNGRIVHQQSIEVTTEDGEVVEQPIIIIYEVRP